MTILAQALHAIIPCSTKHLSPVSSPVQSLVRHLWIVVLIGTALVDNCNHSGKLGAAVERIKTKGKTKQVLLVERVPIWHYYIPKVKSLGLYRDGQS